MELTGTYRGWAILPSMATLKRDVNDATLKLTLPRAHLDELDRMAREDGFSMRSDWLREQFWRMIERRQRERDRAA